MIDIVIYASCYVLVSKLIECRRDKFIKNWLYTEPEPIKKTVLLPSDLKKYTTLKKTHIL